MNNTSAGVKELLWKAWNHEPKNNSEWQKFIKENIDEEAEQPKEDNRETLYKLEKIADDYAERVCNGQFPITYSREQVVKHTAGDFIAGASEFQRHVLSVLKENYEACKNLVDEDKIRTAQDIVNETYEDLIEIFSTYEWLKPVQSSKEDVQEQGISDEAIVAMAEEYADNYANLEWPQSISETFIAGAKAIRDKQKDKIRMAIDWCDEQIKKVDPVGDAAILRAPYKAMKQYLESIKDK